MRPGRIGAARRMPGERKRIRSGGAGGTAGGGGSFRARTGGHASGHERHRCPGEVRLAVFGKAFVLFGVHYVNPLEQGLVMIVDLFNRLAD